MTCTGDQRWLNDVTALARMLKVLRLARAGPLISRLTQHMTAHSAYINAAKFFLYVIVVAHVLACLFYMIPILFECDSLHGEVTDNGEVWNSNHSCMATSWRVNHGLNDVNNNVDRNGNVLAEVDRPMATSSQYISALYWSLTTMTTIGYGDRGPGNDPEIAFTMCSELIGLFFFVLLLEQITTVYNEVRREQSNKNAIKDEIIQYMKGAIPTRDEHDTREKKGLIQKVVTFLNFKANSQSSHQFDPDGAFGSLSETLQEEINVAVFRPMLAEIRMFGHCEDDKKEAVKVEELFHNADTGGNAEPGKDGELDDAVPNLDESEIRALINSLMEGVEISDEDLREAMDQMDSSKSKVGAALPDAVAKNLKESEVHVELEEFEQWWYQQKHKRPKVSPCPNEMLSWFALRIRSECSSPGDRIVRKGEYGDVFYIALQGTIEIRDHALEGKPDETWTQDEREDPFSRGLLLRAMEADNEKESDPIFGLLVSTRLNPAFPCAVEAFSD